MFKFFIVGLLFLLILLFGLLFWAYFLEKIRRGKDCNNDQDGENKEIRYNDYFSHMSELEARMEDIEVLSNYFDGVVFQGFEMTETHLVSTYSFVEAKDIIFKTYIENERIAKLQELIRSDLVRFFDRYYSSFIFPGFSYNKYIEVDAGVYRRIKIKRVRTL